ncbi:hypothetical protein [Curtobacterium sp. BRB10]|uniref:hypothetical protein n=1 Tax=Curtobacterium sp. BRB10 TaxID=2962579 RepID=UPI002881C4B0|nr:hypothetical protein [Curtobacterium sp. BRB10]MDT0234445.1 hypothetical protein [Curtobacterium sp. BRB10]
MNQGYGQRDPRDLERSEQRTHRVGLEREFVPAETLSEATIRVRMLTGVTPESTRGEKRALLALRDALRLDVATVETNAVLGAALADALNVTWLPAIYVDTNKLTLAGVNALLEGATFAYQEGALRALQPKLSDHFAALTWSGFQSAVSKIEAVTRIAALTNSGPEWLGPGSKEHKSVLINLGASLLPGLNQNGLSKTQLAAAIAQGLDAPWSDDFISTGETIRLNGLNAILAGAERRLGRLGSSYAAGLTPEAEGVALVDALWQKMLTEKEERWDGKEKIEWLRDEGTRQENQMEWPGFYFEYRGRDVLNSTFRPNPHPVRVKYGHTVFDYSLNHVWDLKSHTAERERPGYATVVQGDDEVQLNDASAVRACVDEQGLGFIILTGRAVSDEDGEFKRWHDEFKGKPSRPSLSGKSRARKAAFLPLAVEAYWISNTSALNAGVLSGALKAVPQGRQSSGAARPDKFHMRLEPARRIMSVASRASRLGS